MGYSLAERVIEVYRVIDQGIENLKNECGLSCPFGCGTCCESPNVEASILEMLPVAIWMFESGEVDMWLEKLATKGDDPTCVFYTPETLSYGQGRCGIYPIRPSMCRLFGYAAVRDKLGNLKFGACKVMKAVSPDEVAEVIAATQRPGAVLSFADASNCVASVDPVLGTARLAINRAVIRAVERIGLEREMMCADEPSEISMLKPEDDTPRPWSPRNAA